MSPAPGSDTETLAGSAAVPPKRRDVVQSLERGLAVVLAFADHPRPMTVVEIAQRTGLSRPAVRRLLITLGKLGYVTGDGPRYALTPRILRLGYAYLSSQPLVDMAEPHMEQLAVAIHESCSLAALDSIDAVIIGRVEIRRILNISLEVGTRLPAYASAHGRALLSGLSPAELDGYLTDVDLVPLTPHTIADAAELRVELDRIRNQGWCVVDQDFEDGVRSASVPVHDAGGRVVAALGTSLHAGMVDLDAMRSRILPHVVRAADAITADLSHHRGTWRL